MRRSDPIHVEIPEDLDIALPLSASRRHVPQRATEERVRLMPGGSSAFNGLACQKIAFFWLSAFPMVCPEPALVK